MILAAGSKAAQAADYVFDLQSPWYNDPKRPNVTYIADGVIAAQGAVAHTAPA